MGAMGNVVDNTYNGVYHVNVTLHFCPAEEKYGNSGVDDDLDYEFGSGANLILPISRNLRIINCGLRLRIPPI